MRGLVRFSADYLARPPKLGDTDRSPHTSRRFSSGDLPARAPAQRRALEPPTLQITALGEPSKEQRTPPTGPADSHTAQARAQLAHREPSASQPNGPTPRKERRRRPPRSGTGHSVDACGPLGAARAWRRARRTVVLGLQHNKTREPRPTAAAGLPASNIHATSTIPETLRRCTRNDSGPRRPPQDKRGCSI